MTKPNVLFVVLLLLALTVVACSSSSGGAENIPPVRTTDEPIAFATPTDVPLSRVNDNFEAPDWNNIEHMYAAMRPDYTEDVDAFKDVQRYYIEAELEYGIEMVVVRGQQVVRYTNTAEVGLDEIVFRLTAEISSVANAVRVENITVNDTPTDVTYEARGSIMAVPLETELMPGESVEIGMEFVYSVERGFFVRSMGDMQNQWQAMNWMPVVSVFEGPERGWFRDLHFGSDWDPYYGATSLWDVKLTYPDSITLGSSGVVIDRTLHDDGMITDHIVTGPMRDHYTTASPRYGVITDVVDGITINVFFMPGGERGAQWVMESAIRSFEIFNKAFGEYPYAELDVVQVETGAGGTEHPGIITVDTNFWLPGSPNTESITAHEVAHQYWYQMVGNNQMRTPALDEALASFSEGVYWREAYDDDGQRFTNWVENARGQVSQARNFYGDASMAMWQSPNDVVNPTFAGVLYYPLGRVFYSDLEAYLHTPATRVGMLFAENDSSALPLPRQ